MSERRIRKPRLNSRVAALLFGAACLSVAVVTEPMARQGADGRNESVRFLGTQVMADSPQGMATAAKSFVRAMAEGDAEELWMFATEEEHAAFQTKPVAYRAYALDFPALTRAEEATFLRAWKEGETPFVVMIVRDKHDRAYLAELGLWLSDAGDWKVVSLAVEPSSEVTAGL